MSASITVPGLSRPLPELELEVMKALWRLEDGTVADVKEQLDPFRPLAYTTVMTVLDRLARKGAVSRAKQGRGYLYKPAITSAQAREVAIERLLHDHFNDSPEKLAAFLLNQDRGESRQTVGSRTMERSAAALTLDSALL